jgi:hypothetical protein
MQWLCQTSSLTFTMMSTSLGDIPNGLNWPVGFLVPVNSDSSLVSLANVVVEPHHMAVASSTT